jgi:hypothetical protein
MRAPGSLTPEDTRTAAQAFLDAFPLRATDEVQRVWCVYASRASRFFGLAREPRA